jgi:Flp pilus assembly pilin Flp
MLCSSIVHFVHLISFDEQRRPLGLIERSVEEQMEFIGNIFIRTREILVKHRKAQTMTEYVLILAAIAIVVYGTYTALGNNISSFASGADSVLTNA